VNAVPKQQPAVSIGGAGCPIRDEYEEGIMSDGREEREERERRIEQEKREDREDRIDRGGGDEWEPERVES
jgi:hypothetical protein